MQTRTDAAYKNFERTYGQLVRQIDTLAKTVHGLNGSRHTTCIDLASTLLDEVQRLREFGGDREG